MVNVTVVGSGASGAHFAQSLLSKGHRVTMIDVGRTPGRGGQTETAVSAADMSLNELKRSLPDPFDYFIGRDLDALTLPGSEGEFYGIPPHKQYIFETAEELAVHSAGFAPLFSHARGGLAEAWTGGVYPLTDDELADFPFGYADIEPYYSEVSRRIGITGEVDDLSRYMPVHDHLLPPLNLDEHSTQLMSRYRGVRQQLNDSLACHLGRSRVATLSRDLEGRRSCDYLGRCIWGCPIDSLYTPSMTIEACRRYDSFEYLEGLYVERFGFDEDRRVRAVTVREVAGGKRRDLPVEHLALAAGALASSRIFLESMRVGLGQSRVLTGLMDNRQVLVPFVNVRRLGVQYDAESYQYHQLALGLECDRPDHYVHGQITTLTTAQVHPVLQSIPMDFRTAGWVFRNARAALGLVNLNFHDFRRPECRLSLDPTSGEGEAPLSIAYTPDAGQETHVAQALKRLKKALRRLGCHVVPGTEHVRPMGASVHYSGTIPMSDKPEPLTASSDGQSRDFQNLYLVDGTTFPFLPAKNLTFTLMANAARIADRAF